MTHVVQGGGSSLLGERVDIMELLESAGNSYLNQVLYFDFPNDCVQEIYICK